MTFSLKVPEITDKSTKNDNSSDRIDNHFVLNLFSVILQCFITTLIISYIYLVSFKTAIQQIVLYVKMFIKKL